MFDFPIDGETPSLTRIPMGRYYICAVSARFPENYDLGVHSGKWGVETRHRRRIESVRPGDHIVFVVGGEFRSIHPVVRGPHEDHTLLWPRKDGDVFPFRIDIGPAEVAGRVMVADLASGISFMRGKVWGGTLRGLNGVFNDRLTPEDVRLIRDSLAISPAAEVEVQQPPKVVQLQGTRWLPALLDQIARLSDLTLATGFPDPFAGAAEWQGGLVSRVYADRRSTPTLALLPVDQDPNRTVLSALYGMSSLKQSPAAPAAVRGVIFVPEQERDVGSLLRGLPNLQSVAFHLHASLQS